MYTLVELTIADWKKPSAIMPIVKRTSDHRKEVAGEEKVLSKFLGISGDPDSPIINFRTMSTSDKSKEYRTRIQLFQFSKWITSSTNTLKLSEFKEILDVCDIKFDCECPFWHWGGLKYMATEMDSAIVTTNIPNSNWKNKKDYSEPSLCKHLSGVIKLIIPFAGKILNSYKHRWPI